MYSPPTDLSPATAALLIQHWREKTVWQKLAYVGELNETLKTLALSDLRRRYPQATEPQLQRRLAERWLGVELAAQVYGPIGEDNDAAS